MSKSNYQCEWRLESAKKICEKLKCFEGVEAIVVGGSVARGYADEYSDVEIPIFWDTLPDEDTRKLIVRELKADYFYPYDYESREDNLIINGFRIDLWHIAVSHEEAVINSVYTDFQTDLGLSNAMDTLRSCIPLFGGELVDKWKNRVKEYPRQLAIKNIKECLKSVDGSQVGLYFRRDNPTLVFEQIISLQKNIFLMLLALNNEYFPTFKWMYKSLGDLKSKPKNIYTRFREVFACSPEEAYDKTVAVFSETLELINEAYPEIDSFTVKSKLKPARIPHEHPVSLVF